MPNKRRLDKNTLFIVGAVLGLETVAGAGVGMSIHNKKMALEQTLKGKEAALADVRTVSASLPALQDQYGKMQAQVKFLERSLPPAAYIPTLLGQVEETARASNIEIKMFRPKVTPPQASDASADKPSDGSGQRQFDIQISGSYANVQKFLHSLTKFRKVLALDTIQLQPGNTQGATASPDLTGHLSFTAYILPPGPGDNPAAIAPPAGKAVASSESAPAPRG
jgi:Tfp pilus assembly protein PilO